MNSLVLDSLVEMSYNLENGVFKNKIYIKGNKPITNDIKVLLEKYEIIHFNRAFNQDLGNLPNNIKAIYFEEEEIRYNYKTKYRIIVGETSRYEDYEFNQTIGNLPNGIEYLELRGNFNQPLDNLPNTLKYLYINSFKFSHSLDFLPVGLECLILGTSSISISININNFPSGLKELYINGYINEYADSLLSNFHIGLKTLYVNGKNNKLDESFKLPDTLETFIFNDCKWDKHNIKILKKTQFSKKMMQLILPIDYVQDYSLFTDKIKKECNDNCIIKFMDFYDPFTDFNDLIKHILNKY